MKVAEKRQHKNENEEIESKATTDKRRWITRIKKKIKKKLERGVEEEITSSVLLHTATTMHTMRKEEGKKR